MARRRRNGSSTLQKARKVILSFLQNRDWTSSTDILNAVTASAETAFKRTHGVAALMGLRNDDFVLKTGRPPRGCMYKLNPERSPEEEDEEDERDCAPRAAAAPALQYVAPAIGHGPLTAALGPRPGALIEAFA